MLVYKLTNHRPQYKQAIFNKSIVFNKSMPYRRENSWSFTNGNVKISIITVQD